MRGFKTKRTRNYIKNPKSVNLKPPYETYSFIDHGTRERFVKSHNTFEFLTKIQRGNENRAKNTYPHRLSRGRYDKLKETMIKGKKKTKRIIVGRSFYKPCSWPISTTTLGEMKESSSKTKM